MGLQQAATSASNRVRIVAVRNGERDSAHGRESPPAAAAERRPAGRWLLAALALPVFAIGALYGMAVVTLHWPPYWTLRSLGARLIESDREGRRPDLAVVSVRSAPDVVRRRSGLVGLLWGSDRLPSRGPDRIERGIADPRFAGLPGLARLDRLTVRMEFGLDSKVDLFVPRRANGRLILYHRGHEGDLPAHRRAIGRLVAEGFEVAAFSMPMVGDNSRPVVRHPRLGRLEIGVHDQLGYLVPPAGHPVKYFVEPVIVVLNRLLARGRYRSVSMIGLSGGGWTTTMAAAVDPRIAQSFPVAGSLPLDLRRPAEFGDFEQTVPAVYEVANYYELYILGASGPGRRQLQILNEFDSCCFGGRAAELYRGPIDAIVRSIGPGSFDVMIDAGRIRHEISDRALSRIVAEIGR